MVGCLFQQCLFSAKKMMKKQRKKGQQVFFIVRQLENGDDMIDDVTPSGILNKFEGISLEFVDK